MHIYHLTMECNDIRDRVETSIHKHPGKWPSTIKRSESRDAQCQKIVTTRIEGSDTVRYSLTQCEDKNLGGYTRTYERLTVDPNGMSSTVTCKRTSDGRWV